MSDGQACSTDTAVQFNTMACLDVVDAISERWQHLAAPEGSPISTRRKDVNNAFAILGLASHVLRLGPEVTALVRDGKAWAVAPLVRLCFECGITAQWIRHVDDGFAAFAYEGHRQRKSLLRSIENSEIGIAGTVDESVAEDMPNWLAGTESEGSARNFEQMCRDLEPGGSSYYAMYRVLSTTSHASVNLADTYFVVVEPELDALPAYTSHPDSDWNSVAAFSVAASVIWAGRALGMVLKQDRALKAFRSEIYAAARVLRVVPDLKLSKGAWLRLNKRGAERATT